MNRQTNRKKDERTKEDGLMADEQAKQTVNDKEADYPIDNSVDEEMKMQKEKQEIGKRQSADESNDLVQGNSEKIKNSEKSGEESSKRSGRMSRMLLSLLTTICVLGLAGISCFSFVNLMTRTVSGNWVWFNPLMRSASEDLRQESVYQDMVQFDVASLMDFLAASSLLVTDGQFDTEKKIDVIAYVNRKGRETSEQLAKVKLEYCVGDLIQWYREGISYKEEAYLPADGKSLLDHEFPDGVEEQDVWDAILMAAIDLTINYEHYNEWAEAYAQRDDLSLKYAMCDSKGDILFSNMSVDGTLTKQQIESLELAYSYLCYDFADNTLVKKGIGNGSFSEIDAKNLFHKYTYLFKDGGVIYIAIDTGVGPATLDALGKTDPGDSYVAVYTKYQQIGEAFPGIIFLGGGLFVVSIVLLICFTKAQPKGRKDNLRLVDRGFTEVVGAVAVCLAAVVFSLYEALVDYMVTNGYASPLTEDWIQVFCVLTYTAALLLHGLFLFFYGSLVRRIKAGVLVKNSLCAFVVHVMKWLCGTAYSIAKNAYEEVKQHTSLYVRIWIPYSLFLFINLILLVMGKKIGFFLALLFDAVIGWMMLQDAKKRDAIMEGIAQICDGDLDYQIDTKMLNGTNLVMANAVNQIGSAVKTAVEKSRKDERLKTELITNVSHDIKTPLTSIINYVDLLKKEKIENAKAKEYIEVLDQKSQRLKHLILDLVEASKISSGNIQIEYQRVNLLEFMHQALGEYEDRFLKKNLEVIFVKPERKNEWKQQGQVDDCPSYCELTIMADPRHIWRVMDNLLSNICKYAMENTRVYIDLNQTKETAVIILRNISKSPLHIPADELLLRFTRGDEARSTEGSGLGLSIAQSLVTAQGGTMEIILDGDLFKVQLTFPAADGTSFCP